MSPFFKKAPAKLKEKIIHQFVFVEVPAEVVWPEFIRWADTPWWPKEGHLKVLSRTSDEPNVGVRYRQTLAKPMSPRWDPLAPHWEVEITKFIPQQTIERTFVRGPLAGYERIQFEWRYNGTRIDYELHYRVKGLHNKFFWNLASEKLYSQSMKLILENFKRYITKFYKEQNSKKLENG